jgi:hypothetical protein
MMTNNRRHSSLSARLSESMASRLCHGSPPAWRLGIDGNGIRFPIHDSDFYLVIRRQGLNPTIGRPTPTRYGVAGLIL